MLATLCLNEMEHLPNLWRQHKDWPGLACFCLVEAADPVFARENPSLVRDGLSIDGTTEFIKELSGIDNRVVAVHAVHSPAGATPADQHKCAMRQHYLDVAEEVKPDFLMVLDADEMYTRQAQADVSRLLTNAGRHRHAFVFRQRHIWRPPNSPLYPLREVTGGYWSVPHVRGWRWQPGLQYRDNHNWIQAPDGRYLNHLNGGPTRFDLQPGAPECVHMGYASSGVMRRAKHLYYRARGEGSEGDRRMRRTRQAYVDCRSAWEAYQEGDTLPHGARVLPYSGPVPECFQEG